MIFKATYQQVLDRDRTQTRRPVKPGDYAYVLGEEGRQEELEEFLRRNRELYPALCPHHHALFEYHPRVLVRWLAKEGAKL